MIKTNLLSGALGAEITGIDLKDSTTENWNKISNYKYQLIEGRLRYWSWVIAFGREKKIPALIRNNYKK